MNELAMVVGYSVLMAVATLIVYVESEIVLRGHVKKLVVVGVGPVWFRKSKTGPLFQNMRNLGYRIYSYGDWAFGLSLPKWLGRIVRRVAG